MNFPASAICKEIRNITITRSRFTTLHFSALKFSLARTLQSCRVKAGKATEAAETAETAEAAAAAAVQAV